MAGEVHKAVVVAAEVLVGYFVAVSEEVARCWLPRKAKECSGSVKEYLSESG